MADGNTAFPLTMDYDELDDSMSMTQRSLRTNIARRLRSASWNAHETSTLISLWSEYIDQLRKARRTSKIFRELTHRLQTVYAIKRTPLEVKYKIANLSKEYRRRVRLFGPSNRSNWPYFDDVQRLLQSMPETDGPFSRDATASHAASSQVFSSLNQVTQQEDDDDILESELIIPNECPPSEMFTDKEESSSAQSSSQLSSMLSVNCETGNPNASSQEEQDIKPNTGDASQPSVNRNRHGQFTSLTSFPTTSQSYQITGSSPVVLPTTVLPPVLASSASSQVNNTVATSRTVPTSREIPAGMRQRDTGFFERRNPTSPASGASNPTMQSVKELVQLRKESIRMTDKYRSEKLVLLKEQLHLQRESNVLQQRILHVLEKLVERREHGGI